MCPLFLTLFHTVNRLLDGYFAALYAAPSSAVLAPHLAAALRRTHADMDAMVRLCVVLESDPDCIRPHLHELCADLRALIAAYTRHPLASTAPVPPIASSLAVTLNTLLAPADTTNGRSLRNVFQRAADHVRTTFQRISKSICALRVPTSISSQSSGYIWRALFPQTPMRLPRAPT